MIRNLLTTIRFEIPIYIGVSFVVWTGICNTACGELKSVLVAQRSVPSLRPVPNDDERELPSAPDTTKTRASRKRTNTSEATINSTLALEPPGVVVPVENRKLNPPDPRSDDRAPLSRSVEHRGQNANHLRTAQRDQVADELDPNGGVQGNVPADRLAETQADTQSETQVEELPNPSSNSEPRRSPDVQRIYQHLDRVDREQQEKLRAIREKMAKVQKLTTAGGRNATPTKARSNSTTAKPVSVEPTPDLARPQITESDLKAAEERLQLIKPKVVEEPAPVAADWKTGTVDKMALADSLFASGKAELAEKSYTELAAQSLSPADRVWVIYQLAACSRIRGDQDTAMRLYRQIAAGKSSEELYWAERSLWWLKQLDISRKLKDRQTKLAESIKELETKTNELRATKTP